PSLVDSDVAHVARVADVDRLGAAEPDGPAVGDVTARAVVTRRRRLVDEVPTRRRSHRDGRAVAAEIAGVDDDRDAGRHGLGVAVRDGEVEGRVRRRGYVDALVDGDRRVVGGGGQ